MDHEYGIDDGTRDFLDQRIAITTHGQGSLVRGFTENGTDHRRDPKVLDTRLFSHAFDGIFPGR
jgi:hypothetical protein